MKRTGLICWSYWRQKKSILKIIAFLFSLILLTIQAQSETLLTFDFEGISGNETSVNPNMTIANLAGSAITRSSGVSAASNANRFNSGSWTTTCSPDDNDYLEFSIAPADGFALNLNEIEIKHQRSGTGPTMMAIKCSADGYSSIIDTVKTIQDLTSTQTTTFFFQWKNINELVSFRVYGFCSESNSGTWGPGDGTGNDITLTGELLSTSAVENPSDFNALAYSSNEIDLTWSLNASSDQVLLAFSDQNLFGSPENGVAYSADDPIPSGGTVVYKGNATTFSHQALSENATLFYKIWSINQSDQYSSGCVTQATTLVQRPDQPANQLTATARSHTIIGLSWQYNEGVHPANGFLLIASASAPPSDPADGFWCAEDSDPGDGSLCFLLDDSLTAFEVTGLDRSSTWYFSIYAFSNQGAQVLYNTSSGTEHASAVTMAGPALFISEVTAPSVTAGSKFIEIYNYGNDQIDLTLYNVNLARQTNGGSTWGNVALTGMILPHSTFTIAYNAGLFVSTYGIEANQTSGAISGNGDDGYFLYFDGDRNSGQLIDAYGCIDQDGTGTEWDYALSKAERKNSVLTPNLQWTASEWNITKTTPQRCSPGRFPATVWNGSVDHQWSNDKNWDNGTPSSAVDALIWSGASRFPDAETGSAAKNLTVQHNTQLNHQECLQIEGSATIEQELTFSTSPDQLNHWQYFSSPFNSITAGEWLSNNSRIDLYLANYNNLLNEDFNQAWEQVNSLSSEIVPGTGYAVTLVNDTSETGTEVSSTFYTIRLKGQLPGHLTSIPFLLSINGENGWNLIGNPWLAPLDWTNSTIDLTNVAGSTAYLYDPQANNNQGAYISVQSNGITVPAGSSSFLPAKSAFFVFANQPGSFTLPASARVNDIQHCYKSQATWPTLRIKIVHDSCSDETVLVFDPESDNQTDRFDARKLISNHQKNPSIYLVNSDSYKSVINHIGSVPAQLPLGIIAPLSDTIRIETKIGEGWDEDCDFRLIDQEEKKVYQLATDSTIALVLQEMITENRFILSINKKTPVKRSVIEDWKIVNENGVITVNKSTNFEARITIFNLAGQLILKKEISTFDNQINLSGCSGLFLIKIEEAGSNCLQRLFINN